MDGTTEQAGERVVYRHGATHLSHLNTIFRTAFTLTPEVRVCLVGFIDDGCDLGLVYGYLRPWLPHIRTDHQFAQLPRLIQARRQADSELRSKAIDSNRITTRRIPPRRIWDLYANRVLPFYAVASTSSDIAEITKTKWDLTSYTRRFTNENDAGLSPRSITDVPDNIWAVSHSWVAAPDRQSVLTTVNGKAWRVPIPRKTTLKDIRAELLLLGAEKVFLDVLCLRQEDELLPESESIRKREWRLDVPTIGHVYNDHRRSPVIVYFDGLGLPFRDSEASENRFHWLKRTWTLQETCTYIIPAGLQNKVPALHVTPAYHDPWASKSFLDGLKATLGILYTSQWPWKRQLGKIIAEIKMRSYSNPVDQVACLAYILECPTLPIYDADMSAETAWGLLVECLPRLMRLTLLFSDFGPNAYKSCSWRPTWEQVKNCEGFQEPRGVKTHEELSFLSGSSPNLGYKHGSDIYVHRAYVIEGCHIAIPDWEKQDYAYATIRSARGAGSNRFCISQWGTPIEPGVSYVLVGVGDLKYWVVALYKGTRIIQGVKALEVAKVSTLTIPDSDESENPNQFRRKVDGSVQLVVYC